VKSRAFGERYEILTEINMIPLIDVSLVLLIIFMIMTPTLMRSKINVDLPKASTGSPENAQKKMVQVQIRHDGAVLVDGTPATLSTVGEVIARTVAQTHGDGVLVEADKGVEFQRFVSVIDAARAAGVSKFGVAVRPEAKPKDRSSPPPATTRRR
jgi:biopolymer transport protein ExbD